MIRHVVMWKFKPEAEGKTKEENMAIVKDSLYALLPIIPEIKRMEIGLDVKHTDMSMDLMLLTEFDNMDTLAYYANHPEHLKVSGYVRKVVETRVVLDCEI
ncbi:MAG: Dabb family protein [Ruminococcaceae bacterium]|nr:Dabb family protein [Oscillospiraceae bacterium]